uniref:Uncharacterized protein n=1 Tax=Octopus bimaculoides TaxID=37653 RepID=A0A0L8GCS6_OCTBM
MAKECVWWTRLKGLETNTFLSGQSLINFFKYHLKRKVVEKSNDSESTAAASTTTTATITCKNSAATAVSLATTTSNNNKKSTMVTIAVPTTTTTTITSKNSAAREVWPATTTSDNNNNSNNNRSLAVNTDTTTTSTNSAATTTTFEPGSTNTTVNTTINNYNKMNKINNTTTATKNMSASTTKINFADAIKEKRTIITFTPKQIKDTKSILTKEGDTVQLHIPKEIIENTNKKYITYRLINTKTKRPENFTTKKIELCLRPIWPYQQHVTWRRKFATIQVRFQSEDLAKQFSTLSLHTDDLVMIPSYLGQRVMKVTVKNVPSQVETQWIISAICLEMEEANILEIAAAEEKNWEGGKKLEVLLHITEEESQKSPHTANWQRTTSCM